MYTFAIVDHLTKVFNYVLLGIRGAKGTPLPRLCFAQLALTLLIATVFATKALRYGWTDGRTNGHPQLLKQISPLRELCLYL